MKRPSPYLKMRVLGAIDLAPGKTIRDRIKAVSRMSFQDEEGNLRRFTWRTISTWLYRYKIRGVTSMQPKPRSDKGKPRKVSPERLLDAIEQVRPLFRGRRVNKGQIYRAVVVERGSGYHHMVTLWFPDRGTRDPYVLDPTAWVTRAVVPLSTLEGWTPLALFDETEQFRAEPAAPGVVAGRR